MGHIYHTASSALAAGGRNRIRTLLLFSAVAVLCYISLNLNTSELLGDLPHSPLTSIDVDTEAASVLLVSAYFPSASSSSRSELKHFLSSTTSPLYIFTPPSQAPLLQRLRGARPLTLNTTFTSLFDVPHLRGLERALDAQKRLNRAKPWHTNKLYALLASKTYFLAEATTHGVPPDYAFWVDPAVTSALPSSSSLWPDPFRVKETFALGAEASGEPADTLWLMPTWGLPHGNFKWWHDGLGPIVADFVDPSFFGGPPPGLPSLAALFAKYHALYLRDEIFVGLDQPVLNTLAVANARRTLTLPGACAAYALMGAEAHAAAARWTWVWSVMAGRARCDDVQVVSMFDVLQERFGKGWTPPRSSLGV